MELHKISCHRHIIPSIIQVFYASKDECVFLLMFIRSALFFLNVYVIFDIVQFAILINSSQSRYILPRIASGSGMVLKSQKSLTLEIFRR